MNTLFEVVKAAGGYTAWSDKHPSYESVNGQSGHGVDDYYAPEINSIPVATAAAQALELQPASGSDRGVIQQFLDRQLRQHPVL